VKQIDAGMACNAVHSALKPAAVVGEWRSGERRRN